MRSCSCDRRGLSEPGALDAITSGPLRSVIGDFPLDSGEVIRECAVSYVMHGKLNDRRDNVILGTTALSSDHHRLDFMIGPGKALDPRRDCIIIVDALGNGLSTSPSNSKIQPGTRFPRFSIHDMVESQRVLLESLSIDGVRAVVGASMGGMQALQWAVSHPGVSRGIVAITPLARTPPWTILIHSLARDLLSDAQAVGRRQSRSTSTWERSLHLLEAIASRTPETVQDELGSTNAIHNWLALQKAGWAEHTLSQVDWTYQSWAYDGHDVGSMPPFDGDTASALRTIRARTLLVVPALDLYNPVHEAHWAARHIPNGQLVTLRSGDGHVSGAGRSADGAREINHAVESFLVSLTD